MTETVLCKIKSITDTSKIAYLTLNRPDAANAFNDALITTFTSYLVSLQTIPGLRLVVLRGSGKNFCAGADLHWMKKSATLAYEENLSESKKMSKMFSLLYQFPVPTVALVQGSIYGGGVGLVACCDIVFAEESSKFALSEARLGLLPAVILPYLARKITPVTLQRLGLTASLFSAQEAKEMGLINHLVTTQNADEFLQKEIDLLLSCGPHAQGAYKTLYRNLWETGFTPSSETWETIAKVRKGEEAQAGIAAFFEKKSPPWVCKLPSRNFQDE